MKKIIKYLLCSFVVISLVGCSMGNTPTKKVENFLDSYRKQDENVITQLKEMIDSDNLMDENQKETYSDIIKKQYSDLTYNIKNETINGDKATVTAEIEVYDFYKANKEAEEYYNNNKKEFEDNSVVEDVKEKAKDVAEGAKDAITSDSKYINYRLGKLKDADDRIKYTVDFTLTKNDGNWKLDDIDDVTRQKIHGLYEH